MKIKNLILLILIFNLFFLINNNYVSATLCDSEGKCIVDNSITCNAFKALLGGNALNSLTIKSNGKIEAPQTTSFCEIGDERTSTISIEGNGGIDRGWLRRWSAECFPRGEEK